MEHDLGRPGQFFETRGQRLHFNASDARLCFGDSGEVGLERAQDRAGLSDAPSQIRKGMLEIVTALALFGVLLDV
jgi:hypothetical protein